MLSGLRKKMQKDYIIYLAKDKMTNIKKYEIIVGPNMPKSNNKLLCYGCKKRVQAVFSGDKFINLCRKCVDQGTTKYKLSLDYHQKLLNKEKEEKKAEKCIHVCKFCGESFK